MKIEQQSKSFPVSPRGTNDWPGTRYRQCFASVEKTSSEVTVPPGFLSQPGPTPCSTAVELKEMMLEKAR